MKRQAGEIAQDIDRQIPEETLEHMMARLDRFAVPEPGPAETEALIAHLRPLMPPPAPAAAPRFRDVALAPPRPSMLRTLLPQIRLFHPVWWLGSLGAVLVALLVAGPLAAEGIPLSSLSPLLIIAGIAYGFASLRGAALELELSCPITPAQATLGRILVVLGYCLGLGALVALAYRGPAVPLFLAWCAALVFFAGLVLALSLVTGTGGAIALSLLVWAAQLLLRKSWPTLFTAPSSPGWMTIQTAALLAGGLMMTFAFSRRGLLLKREDA